MDWATHYCDLLRQACPEDFGQVPLYLVDKHDVPERFWLEGCGGCTSPAMDLDLQPMLESAGLWRGRGYLMAVDVAAHPTTEMLTATVIHEAAHWLTYPVPVEFTAEETAICKAAGWDATKQPLIDFVKSFAERPSAGPQPPWFGHDLQFIRAALHIWGRWRPWLKLDDLNVAGASYGLSDLWLYRCRCDDELLASTTGSVREILAAPHPPAINTLFESDTERNLSCPTM